MICRDTSRNSLHAHVRSLCQCDEVNSHGKAESSPCVKRVFATLWAASLAAGIFGGARAAAPKASSATQPQRQGTAGVCANPRSKYEKAMCSSFTHSAPGDEYFGRMKLSYLGINNTFRDEAVRAGAYTTDPGIVSRVGFADEALQAWSNKYPGDPQLPRSYFLGIQVMRKIYTQPMQDRAWQIMQTLTKNFPSTYFGKIMAASLKRGFTETYFAVPKPCPTPVPTLPPGVRSTPKPPPTPEPTPEPPTPSPAPGQPRVVVMIPPCVVVTPSPSPSATPNWPLPAPLQPVNRGSASPAPLPSGALTPQPTERPSTRPTRRP